jgi:hypothetical protein
MGWPRIADPLCVLRDGSRDLIVRDVVGFSRSGLRVVLGLISGYFTQLACNSHPAA